MVTRALHCRHLGERSSRRHSTAISHCPSANRRSLLTGAVLDPARDDQRPAIAPDGARW